MKIIAFDPGGTTGFAVGYLDEEKGILSIRADEHKFDHNMLFAQLVIVKPDWVITESFEYRSRARTGLELISSELIGVIKLYAQQSECGFSEQTASTGKGYYTDAKLKTDGLYEKGKPHAMDALRHLLHWYTFAEGYQYNIQGYERSRS